MPDIKSIHVSEPERNIPHEAPGQPEAGEPPDPGGKSEPEQPGQQPSALPSPGPQVITSSERHYKAGVYAERQKFGKPKHAYQMTLAETQTDWSPEDADLLGITATVEEDKALSAVQILLDRTGYTDKGIYKGNLPPDLVRSSNFKWEGDLPNLAFTWPEYLEAYGLKRGKNGRFPRLQEDRAKKAFEALTQPKRIIYQRTRFEGGKKVYDAIACEWCLIRLIEGYEGLTDEELQGVKVGRLLERATRLVLQPSPLFLDCLDTFHTYKPANLHEQIEELVASQRGKRGRIPRSYSLFIQLLHTVNWAEFKVDRDRLVDTLLLAKYREQRKIKQAYQQIDECLDIAQELGYILSYEEDALGLIVMQLNPAKLSRVKAKLERQQEREAKRQALEAKSQAA